MGRRTTARGKSGDRNGGQALILVALVPPLLMSLAAVVVDGANLMAHRRAIQNAADAASLAVAQEIDVTTGAYDSTCLGYADDYARKNGWSGPTVEGLFTNAVGLGKTFSVSASATAAANPEIDTTVIPGTTSAGFTDPNQTIPGQTHTSTDPPTLIGDGDGDGFAMSRLCDGAGSYTGAGAGGLPLGAFATNGGLTFSGATPKKVTSLYDNKSGCTSNPPTPPSGTSACTSTVTWGDSSDSNNNCVKNLVDLGSTQTLPINWPLTPPSVPTILLPDGSRWTPSTNIHPVASISGAAGRRSRVTTR